MNTQNKNVCDALYVDLDEAIDLKKLPSEKALAPYLTVSATCVIPAEDGILIEQAATAARFLEEKDADE